MGADIAASVHDSLIIQGKMMPRLSDRQPNGGLRVLLLGDPGAGKSSAIGKLAEHEQELFICDFDSNLAPLPKFIAPEALSRIHFETLVDPVEYDGNGKPIVKGIPPAFSNFVKLTSKWVDSSTGEDYGNPDEWGMGRWFVMDSLTTFGNAAMNYTMFKRKRFGKRRGFAEWGDAIERVEGALQLFAGSSTHLICTAHLARLNMEDVTADADEEGKPIDHPTAAKRLPPNAAMRYPVALGQKLPPRIGGYFNLVLQAQRIGSGVGARRVLRTVPEEDVDIKVPLPPRTVPPEVPIDQLWSILKPFVRGD